MSWIVTTVGTGDASGTIPLVKWTTSTCSCRSIRGASVCIQTIRGIRHDELAICTLDGQRARRVDRPIRDDDDRIVTGPRREVVQQVLGVVADAGAAGTKRRAVKCDAHGCR